MARSAFRDLFRLPTSAAILIVSAVVGGRADAHALPRQTATVAYHELNVVAWPPIPTEAPLSPFELLRRQEENTVCGYIGDLAATCSAGSHCVLDTANSVIGCCPNGGTCTTGVFTGCVDFNSGAQTEANPYVYTCEGSDVCYRNNFGNGIYQYGCGTNSNLATSVRTSATGSEQPILVTQTSVALTESPSSLSEPTSINPSTGTHSSSKTSKSSSTSTKSSTKSSTTSSSSSSTSSSSPTISTTSASSATPKITSSNASTSPTSSPTLVAAPSTGSSFDRTGAIVGGTISGVAILVALVAIAIFYVQKQRNRRQGPGPAPPAPPTTEYMSPIRSHGAAFAPLPAWQEEEEPPTPQPGYNQPHNPATQEPNIYNPYGPVTGVPTQIPPGQAHPVPQPEYNQPEYNQSYSPPHPEPTMHNTYGASTSVPTQVPPEQAYGDPSQYSTAYGAEGGVSGTPIAAAYMGPGDYYTQGYMAATGPTMEDDRQPLTVVNPENPDSGSENGSPSRRGSRPLWQQNRRQSRNIVWM